jgi:hypothetical protein
MNGTELAHRLVGGYPTQFNAATSMRPAGSSHLLPLRSEDGDPGGSGRLGRMVREAP